MTVAGMSRALARAAAAKPIDRTEAAVLLQARGSDLERLCRAAAQTRDLGLVDAGRPGVVTYSRKVFVPLTRLCRDRCHYCTFATTPGRLESAYLSPDEVLEIARAGAAAGCKEALFTLGDRPEERWEAARQWLDAAGYADTLSYVRAMAILVLEETGLLPHLNPGVMTWEELQRLKPVAPSMGMMLETTSTELWSEPGGCHFGSPDKDPAVRLRVLEDASRSAVPFTTGILVGIGETVADRADSLFELRRIARQFGAIQEVIVQNFRAKPDTAMRGAPDAEFEEYLATVAVARIVLGPRMRIQVPPNLSRPDECTRLLSAGVDDWGGVSPVTPDHVNPERPWPEIDRLAALTADAGFVLRERLTVHPEYALAGDPWLDPRVVPHVRALVDAETGLARTDVAAVGLPWQEPDQAWESSGRTDLHTAIDSVGRITDKRSDFDAAYGDWGVLRDQVEHRSTVRARVGSDVLAALRSAERNPSGVTADGVAALRAAERDPGNLSGEHALTLMTAEGALLDEVVALADHLRRETVGDDVTYVVNRNINFTNVCYVGCRFCAFAQRRSDADAYSLSLEQVADRGARPASGSVPGKARHWWEPRFGGPEGRWKRTRPPPTRHSWRSCGGTGRSCASR
jgi:FO synthase